MPLVADRVKETTTTAGTGTLTLAGAATGFQSFSAAFGTGAVVYYVIAAGADWEIGIGTTGSGTLSRDTVLQSSNGDALVDWPAGTKDVFCAYVADRAVTTSDPATLTNKTIDDYTNNVGANSTHFRIKAGATLAKGDVVKAVGFTPGEQAIEVVKVASSTDVALGICEQALNTGNFGLAVVIGELFNVNTNGFTVGETLYSNGSGGFTSTKPSSGLYQVLGWVVRANASNGVIAVNVVAPLYVEASTNTVNTAVIRDGSGNFAAATVTAALTGNASTATALSSSRTFALTGDVTGSVSSDLTSGASISTAIAAGVIVDADINASAAIADTKLATISTAGKVSNSATTATNANTASAIVARDASGNFTAGTITAELSGNATTATTATQVANALTAGTYLTSGGTFTGAAARTFAVDATNASTASKVVARDANGSASFKNVKLDGTTSGTVTVQPAAAAGTWSLTLPTTAGSSGQVLSTDGSGVTSWATAGGQTQQTQSSNYTLSTADVGKQIIYTGATVGNAFFLPESNGAALTNGQFIDVVNAGSVDISFGGSQIVDSIVPSVSGNASASARYADGRVLLVGGLSSFTRGGLLRLNTDGTVDYTFAGFTFNGTPTCVTLSADETAIYVGGAFTTITDVATSTTYSRTYIAKFNGATGAFDTAFNASLSYTAQSVAVKGTTVAVSFGSGSYIAFFNSTNGSNLGSAWTNQYDGTPNTYSFRTYPYIRAHPTQNNTFIASNANGYQYYDGDGIQYLYDNTLIHFTSGGPTFTYGDSYYTPGASYPDAIAVTSTHIYTCYNQYVVRYVLGSSTGSTSAYVGPSGNAKSIIIRPSDSAVFVCLNANTSIKAVYAFTANLSTPITLPLLETWNNLGVVGQFLNNGKLVAANLRVGGTNYTLALLASPLQAGANIFYPPYMSGQFPTTGFQSTSGQSFRLGQSMRVQKINGQLYIVQRNTPYQ